MPHKRNPVGCAAVLAAAVRVPGLVASMLSGMVQEHERALGGWQAEWDTLPEIVRWPAAPSSRWAGGGRACSRCRAHARQPGYHARPDHGRSGGAGTGPQARARGGARGGGACRASGRRAGRAPGGCVAAGRSSALRFVGRCAGTTAGPGRLYRGSGRLHGTGIAYLPRPYGTRRPGAGCHPIAARPCGGQGCGSGISFSTNIRSNSNSGSNLRSWPRRQAQGETRRNACMKPNATTAA